MHSLPVDSGSLCGSISRLLATPDVHGTADFADVDAESSAYCELQLATVLQWTAKQRSMILLEQFLANNDDR